LLLADQTAFNKKANIWKRSMEVNSQSSNQILKVKVLRDLQVNIPAWQIKPSDELKQLSMFINPRPYLIRASRLSVLKGDIRAILLNKQEFKCVYCRNKLIEFDNLNKWSTECDNIIDNSNELAFTKENLNNTLYEGKHSSTNLSNKVIGKTWYYNLHVDHIIPKTLAGSIKSCKILLDNDNNKVILHHECHKLKTAMDNKLLIFNLRNIKKNLRKKFRSIDKNKTLDENTINRLINLKATEIIIENKFVIDNYLKYINNIYGDKYFKSGNALIKKIQGIIKKS